MKHLPSYLKAIVICHGKSEVQMCKFLKTKLRLRIEVESDKNGEKSIQILSLMKFLNNTIYKTKKAFLTHYSDDIDKLTDDFKIFIIMDTDDCSKQEKEAFIKKTMFKNHWAYPYIVPIFNDKNLEEVLLNAKIKFEKTGKKMKKEYIKIFPTDLKYETSDTVQIEEFRDNLVKCKNTNMGEFVDFCLKIA